MHYKPDLNSGLKFVSGYCVSHETEIEMFYMDMMKYI